MYHSKVIRICSIIRLVLCKLQRLLTPARSLSISGLKSRVLKLSFFSLKMMVKSGLEFILKLTEPLQRYLLSCQANSAILGRYFCTGQQQLWRGSVNFKINSRPLFTIIFKMKNDNFKTRDFSPLIKIIITGVWSLKMGKKIYKPGLIMGRVRYLFETVNNINLFLKISVPMYLVLFMILANISEIIPRPWCIYLNTLELSLQHKRRQITMRWGRSHVHSKKEHYNIHTDI